MQAVIPLMREAGGGHIVNVSSGTTLMTPRGHRRVRRDQGRAEHAVGRGHRAELAGEGIMVSTVYPFVTSTEFHDRLRAGSGPPRRPGLEPQPAEKVAEAIAEVVATGAECALLVPERLRLREP